MTSPVLFGVVFSLPGQTHVPTVWTFLQFFLRQGPQRPMRLHHVAGLIAERGLQEEEMLCHLPSVIAASSIRLAELALKV